tara:strand:+ start:884 stop:3586 length:2703 start_codon:yes stop_codon:yes gene_type:complete
MPYIGNQHNVGDHVNNFKVLDDISSYTETFNGSATSVVSVADDTIRIPEHRFIQGQRVTYTNGGGGNIGGLTTGTAYYISYDTKNTFKLATSLVNANNNTVINLTAVGSGSSHTFNAAFDGVNTKFKITYSSGVSARLNNATQLNVTINNVLQKPNLNYLSFTEGFAIADTHKIVFKTAPTVNDVFWGSIIANTIENFDLRDNEVDNFTGDGSTTEFTLSTIPANNESVIVSINGVVQHPSDKNTARSYTLIDSILQFTAAPASNDEIQARHIGFAGASTNDVSGFYGRSGNVTLTANDHITTGDITARNFKATGITTFNGDVKVGGALTVSGALTYEDVINVDSVGIVTARVGVHIDDSITHIGDTNTKIRFPAADTITAETGGSERVRITSDGNVGIGSDAPEYALVVQGGASNTPIVARSTDIRSQIAFMDNTTSGVGHVAVGCEGSSLFIRTGTGGRALNIDGAGKVGIDTTIPDGNLHVYGGNAGSVTAATDANELVLESAANVGMSFLTGATSISRIKFGDTTATNRGIFLFNHSDQSFRFQHTSSEKIRIGSSGQIGIAGANYGSSGQVLTSGGSGGSVSWSTIAGLTYFTESENTSSPNNTVSANRFIATGSASNIDAVFQPKGTGAILAQLPDNATSGGNKRGDRAVDWQLNRNNANQVASGEYAVIGGGQRNRVAGYPCSTVAGGQDCKITSGGNSFIGGGYLNTCSGSASSTILAGTYNTCDDAYSTIIGHRAKSRWRGAIIFGANASTAIGNNGGEQSSITHYKGQTTNATATTIGTTGNTPDTIRSITLPNNSAYGFTMTVIGAVGSGGNTSMWKFEGLIKRGANAASTAIVGNVVKNRIAYDSGASAWDVAVTANTSGSLVVTVTGQASTTIRWIANIETTEITYS